MAWCLLQTGVGLEFWSLFWPLALITHITSAQDDDFVTKASTLDYQKNVRMAVETVLGVCFEVSSW